MNQKRRFYERRRVDWYIALYLSVHVCKRTLAIGLLGDGRLATRKHNVGEEDAPKKQTFVEPPWFWLETVTEMRIIIYVERCPVFMRCYVMNVCLFFAVEFEQGKSTLKVIAIDFKQC